MQQRSPWPEALTLAADFHRSDHLAHQPRPVGSIHPSVMTLQLPALPARAVLSLQPPL